MVFRSDWLAPSLGYLAVRALALQQGRRDAGSVAKAKQGSSFELTVAGFRLGPEVMQEFEVDKPSAWIQHVPFMAWCVSVLQPRSYVELGTHWGVSFFTAVQTAQFLKIPLAARAIDLWEGDHQAGSYGNEVHDHVAARAKKFRGVTLTRSLFSDARKLVADGSIDLLHIDGLHTYEAVTEDFETWLSCLSDRGVILFHDVRETKLDFGVHRLWAELEQKYPSFTFDHGHGLGVLLVGSQVPVELRALADVDAAAAGESLRKVFWTLGAALDWQPALDRQRHYLEEKITEAEDEAREAVRAKDKLTQSFSWRITRPLRAVRGRLTR